MSYGAHNVMFQLTLSTYYNIL